MVDVGDADEDDRQIAGYAQAPEARLPAASAPYGVRRRPQHGRGIDDVPGETLVLFCRTAIDAEMVQLHLGLGPGERGSALERAGIVVLVDQIEDVLPRRGDHGPEIDARRRTRRYPHPAAQGEDRIEHRSGRAGKRPPIDRRGGRANAASPAEKSRAIGFELAIAYGLATDDRQVRGPDLWLRRRPPPPRRQYRAQSGEVLGLDEQFGECRVRNVGGLGP